jgi:hypothetical protein
MGGAQPPGGVPIRRIIQIVAGSDSKGPSRVAEHLQMAGMNNTSPLLARRRLRCGQRARAPGSSSPRIASSTGLICPENTLAVVA